VGTHASQSSHAQVSICRTRRAGEQNTNPKCKIMKLLNMVNTAFRLAQLSLTRETGAGQDDRSAESVSRSVA
jgi:hypothetical protein